MSELNPHAVSARMIVEMLGKPKEYIDSTLRKYVDKFRKDLDITKADFAEPKEQEGGLFSVFVELEITFKKVEELFGFCLDAMPSTIEILTPEELKFNSIYLGDFLNDIQSKLHQTDMIVKTVSAQNKHLDKNATNVFQNFIVYALKQKPKTIQQLSAIVGVQPKGLKPFLDVLIKEKKVVLEGNEYKA
jgi:predicted transcriptional regulator